MFTLGYSFQPWEEPRRSPTGRRSSTTSARPPRATASTDEIRFRHRVVARRVVERRRALDGRGRAHRRRRARRCALTCGFLFGCTGYYRYDEGYTPGVRGHRALRRPDRPPAALAGGPRLRRQARRRDRQRRDRGHARAGDGRDGRARDDAAALAELRRLAARRGPDRRRAAPPPAGARPPTRSCAGRTSLLQMAQSTSSAAAGPELMQEADPQGASSAGCRAGYDVDTHFKPELRPVGPAPVPRPRRRPVRGDLAPAPASSRHRPDRDVHRDRASGSSPARSSRPTSSSPRPASTCCSLGGMTLAVDGERGRPRRDRRLQGR